MKFTVKQAEFKRGLSIVSGAVANRTTLPILYNILIVSQPRRLKLQATNLEIGITTYIPADVSEEGSLAIPASTLIQLVSAMSSGNVEISTRGMSASLKCGLVKGNINGISADDFPEVLEGGYSDFSVDSEVMKRYIDYLSFCAENDNARPVLKSLLFSIKEEVLTGAGANGLNVAGKFTANVPGAKDTQALVPAKSFSELGKLISDGQVGVSVSQNQAIFSMPNVTMSTQLMDGQYPDFSAMFEARKPIEVKVSRNELLSAIKAVNVFSQDSSNAITLRGESGMVEVSARSAERGDASPAIEAEMTGDFEISTNGKSLQSVVSALTGEYVSIGVEDAKKPMIVSGCGDSPVKYIVLPMFRGAM
jgi:DNA polymerase-3 subunit beta